MIRIVTDSTCDIPAELLTRHRISVVPVNIQFGQETFQERVDIDEDTFYARVAQFERLPMTSQPSIGQFQSAYRALAAEPDTEALVSIHITGALSGTYNSAVTAASQAPATPPITVFDSRSGSMGHGFMVLEAAEMAESGAGVPQIMARLEELRARMQIFFSMEDLRFARMSGRVSTAQAVVASLLDVKPLLTVQDGQMLMVKRVRTRTHALRALVGALCEKLGDRPARLAVLHAQAPQAAAQVKEVLLAQVNATQVIVHDLSIGIAVHLGPGTVGVVGYTP